MLALFLPIRCTLRQHQEAQRLLAMLRQSGMF